MHFITSFSFPNIFWILRKLDIKSCDALNAGKNNSSQYVRKRRTKTGGRKKRDETGETGKQ